MVYTGPDAMLDFNQVDYVHIDLSEANLRLAAQLLAGRKTRLSTILRESRGWRPGMRSARTLRRHSSPPTTVWTRLLRGGHRILAFARHPRGRRGLREALHRANPHGAGHHRTRRMTTRRAGRLRAPEPAMVR